MAEKELTYGIIAIVVLIILIIGIPTLLYAGEKGLSKENLECKYLNFIPGLCSSGQVQQLTPQQQAQTHNINYQNLLDYMTNLYQNCGKNSRIKCRCEFDYNFFKDTALDLNIISLSGDKIKIQACALSGKEIPGKLYVDKIQPIDSIPSTGKQHTLIDINKISLGYEFVPGAPTDVWWGGIARILGAKDEYWFNIKLDNYNQKWRFSPPEGTYEGKLGILVEGNKKGIYIPYNGVIGNVNIPNVGNNEIVPICQ